MGEPRRRCQRCGCVLAGDQSSLLCSPCARAEMLAELPSVALVLPRGVHVDDLSRSWAQGLDAVTELLRQDPSDAARAVWRAGLAPRRARLDEETFVVLVTERTASHTELADRLGVSRWTIASWRKLLPADPR
jgi:hypothetical protein